MLLRIRSICIDPHQWTRNCCSYLLGCSARQGPCCCCFYDRSRICSLSTSKQPTHTRQFVGWKDISIIYIESICRVKALSLSARLLYLIVDRMFVQWPELAKRYPKAEYHGFLSH